MGVLKALWRRDCARMQWQEPAQGNRGRTFASGMSVSRMEQAVLHLEKHGGEYLDPDYSGLLAFMPQLLTGKGVNLSGLIKEISFRTIFSDDRQEAYGRGCV